MRCVLINNPAAGRNRSERELVIRRVGDALAREGHIVEVATTMGPGTATELARNAAATAEAIFACGGDGTVHEIIQGLASDTTAPTAALGIIPLGSANALARHLHISSDPVVAALEQIGGTRSTIPLGKVTHAGNVRYFVAMAGAGPDGALAYSCLGSRKSQIGRAAYYFRAAQLFLTHRFRAFEVEYMPADRGPGRRRMAVSVMAVRISSLGGIFAGLTSRKASLDDSELRVYILDGPAILSMPLWFVSGWLGISRLNPFLLTVQARSFSCSAIGVPAPHLQLDGESLGQLPFQAVMVQAALTILIPAGSQQV